MKKSFAVLGALVMSLMMWAETVPANDSRIVYVGRTRVVDDNSVAFNWTATYVRIAFTGKQLSVKLTDDVCRNFYNVIIDREISAEPDQVIPVAKDTTIVLCSFKKKGPHTVILQKRTEGEQGTTVIQSFSTDGVFTQAQPLKSRMLEFVGDSYTCGYGTENSLKNDPFKAETESSAKTYAAIVSRYFDADYISVSHSGFGIARNYNSKFPESCMPVRYRNTFDRDTVDAPWNAGTYPFHPAMTVIYLGANDFSCSLQPHYAAFKQQYMTLIQEIKANYGEDHPILCMATKKHEYLGEYMRRLVNECSLKNVNYLVFCPAIHNDDDELGASYHPNYVAHQKLAHSVIPYIATITGWDLQEKPIK